MQPEINKILSKNLKEIKNRVDLIIAELDKEKFKIENIECLETIFIINDSGETKIACLIECGKENVELEKYIKVKLDGNFNIPNIQVVTQ